MNDYEKRWLDANFGDHDVWRARLGVTPAEAPPSPPTDEELKAAQDERKAALDAAVKATVKTYFPHLLDDGDRKPRDGADPKTELDRQVADAAEAFLRSKA